MAFYGTYFLEIMPETLLTSELATRINRHKNTVLRWANAGLLRFRKAQKTMLFNWDEVKTDMEKNGLREGKK